MQTNAPPPDHPAGEGERIPIGEGRVPPWLYLVYGALAAWGIYYLIRFWRM